MGGSRGGGTATTTQTSGISPEFKPAVDKTVGRAGELYDSGQLGRIADTGGIRGALTGAQSAVGTAAGQEQAALQGQAGTLGGLQAQQAGQAQQALSGTGLYAGQNTSHQADLYRRQAQDALGQQRRSSALGGGLGGARAARAEGRLTSDLATNLGALDATAQQQNLAARRQGLQQATTNQTGLAGQQAQALTGAAKAGLQPSQAAVGTQTQLQGLEQQALDAPGAALSQYGQLLQSPGTFAGTQTTTTAPKGGK